MFETNVECGWFLFFTDSVSFFYDLSSEKNCPGTLKMSTILIRGDSEAENLHFALWPKYCETPCKIS